MKRIGSLRTTGEARRQLARLTRSFYQGQITEGDYRALVYGLSALLHYFKHEKQLELEERIETLEQAIEVKQ